MFCLLFRLHVPAAHVKAFKYIKCVSPDVQFNLVLYHSWIMEHVPVSSVHRFLAVDVCVVTERPGKHFPDVCFRRCLVPGKLKLRVFVVCESRRQLLIQYLSNTNTEWPYSHLPLKWVLFQMIQHPIFLKVPCPLSLHSWFLLLQSSRCQVAAPPAADGRCSLSNLGFHLGSFEPVISFTVPPQSQGHGETWTRCVGPTQEHTSQATLWLWS